MATVPVEITWTSGQVVTAAQLNSNLRDAVNFLVGRPMAELRQTVAQSIPSGSAALLFDSEDVDRDNGHSTSSNTSRYTAQTAGWYEASGGCIWNSGTSSRRHLWWRVNGSDLAASEAGASFGSISGVAARAKQIYLNVGNYLELIAMQDSGASISTWGSGTGQAGMSVRWVST